ncbi:MAG: hypothetical protein J6Y02_15215 [Pseudobutyrivibrio sp.]|nr:hypothetical protein [Pseudobutyrivibrio sp.]
MKLNEIKNMQVAKEMPLGTHEVTFKRIQYRTDAEENITGVFVHVEEYRSLFIPFFEQDNFQLDLLLNQLGCSSYDPDEINECKGVKIIATRYKRGEYTNTSFNPNGAANEETFA